MQGPKNIQNPGCCEKACAVVALGARDVCAVVFKGFGDEVEAASAQVRKIAQRSEGVRARRTEEIAAAPRANNNQDADGEEAGESASPHLQQRMAEAWNDPAGQGCEDGETLKVFGVVA